jgi:hypothetical protein
MTVYLKSIKLQTICYNILKIGFNEAWIQKLKMEGELNKKNYIKSGTDWPERRRGNRFLGSR